MQSLQLPNTPGHTHEIVHESKKHATVYSLANGNFMVINHVRDHLWVKMSNITIPLPVFRPLRPVPPVDGVMEDINEMCMMRHSVKFLVDDIEIVFSMTPDCHLHIGNGVLAHLSVEEPYSYSDVLKFALEENLHAVNEFLFGCAISGHRLQRIPKYLHRNILEFLCMGKCLCVTGECYYWIRPQMECVPGQVLLVDGSEVQLNH